MIVVIDNTHNLRKAYMTPKLIKLIEDYTKNPPITLSNEDEVNGAINHLLFRSWSKIFISTNCAIKKAVPDAIAIRGVARPTERITATVKPA